MNTTKTTAEVELKALEKLALEDAERVTIQKQAETGRLIMSSGCAGKELPDSTVLWVTAFRGDLVPRGRPSRLVYIDTYWYLLVDGEHGTSLLRKEALERL